MEFEIKLQDYNILITHALEEAGRLIPFDRYSRKIILVDENSRAYCLPLLMESIPALKDALVLEIPEGEEFKNIETCNKLWDSLLSEQIDRNSLWINLGGGVVSDMGGFVASTFKRGIDFVNFPTTLLAQVDATIGGKLGIDFKGVKNIIGLFKNPRAIVVHPRFLNTLSTEHQLSGFGEIIKHSLISSEEMWGQIILKDPLKMGDWSELIHQSLQIKKKIVEEDFYEKGPRKALNFGHTFGHALESFSFTKDKEKLFHGQAIALGMIAEAYLSHTVLTLSKDQFKSIEAYILANYKGSLKMNLLSEELISFMQHDKKNEGENFNFTLLKAIGDVQVNVECEASQIINSIGYMKTLI